MRKRMSGFVAGFLIISQIFLGCAGITSVRAEEVVGETVAEISSVPDLSLLPALPYDLKASSQETLYMKDRVVFKNVKGEFVAFDFEEGHKVGLSLVYQNYLMPNGGQEPLPENSVFAKFTIDNPEGVYKYVDGKWESHTYDRNSWYYSPVNQAMAPGDSLIFSSVDLNNAIGNMYSGKIETYIPDASFIDFLEHVNSHGAAYDFALPTGANTSARYEEMVLEKNAFTPGYICADGIDNDGDGAVDIDDISCHTDWNASNPASYNAKIRSEAEHILKRLPVKDDGTEIAAGSSNSVFSDDGRFIAYGTMIGGGWWGGAHGEVFLYDTKTGKSERISAGLNGAESNGSASSPTISSDGRYIAYLGAASNLSADYVSNGADSIVYDRQTGERFIASKGLDGNPAGRVYTASISANGRFVVYQSEATNIVEGDTNDRPDVFIYDIAAGTTQCVSSALDGTIGNSYSYEPSISADGKLVAFTSTATNFIAGDMNGSTDIFVKNLDTKEIERVSISSEGTEGVRGGSGSSISPDGNFVSFVSDSWNLIEGDTNDRQDIFTYDRTNRTLQRVSVNSGAEQANDGSYQPMLSQGAKYMVFFSYATNLMEGDTNGTFNAFVRNQATGEVRRLDVSDKGEGGNGYTYPGDITPDGKYILSFSTSNNLVKGDLNGTFDTFKIRNPFIDSLAETKMQCADGIDNDGDGFTDAADGSCHSDGNVDNPGSYDPDLNSEDFTYINIHGITPFFVGGQEVYYNPSLKPDYSYLYFEILYEADKEVFKEGTSMSSYNYPVSVIKMTDNIEAKAKVFKSYQLSEGTYHRAIVQVEVPFETELTAYFISVNNVKSYDYWVSPIKEEITVREKLIPSGQVGNIWGTKFSTTIMGQKVKAQVGPVVEANVGVSTGFKSEISYGGNSGNHIILGYPVEGELNGDIDASIAKVDVSAVGTELSGNLAGGSVYGKGFMSNVQYPANLDIDSDRDKISTLFVPIAGSVLGVTNPAYRFAEMLPFNSYSPYKVEKIVGCNYGADFELAGLGFSLQSSDGTVEQNALTTSGSIFEVGGEKGLELVYGSENGKKIHTMDAYTNKSLSILNLENWDTSIFETARYNDIFAMKIGSEGDEGRIIEVVNGPSERILNAGETYKAVYSLNDDAYEKLKDENGNISMNNIEKALGTNDLTGQRFLEEKFLEKEYYVYRPDKFGMDILDVAISLGAGVKFKLGVDTESLAQVPLKTYYMLGGIEFPLSERVTPLPSELIEIEKNKKTTADVLYKNATENSGELNTLLLKLFMGASDQISSFMDDAKQNVVFVKDEGGKLLDYAGQLPGDAYNVTVSAYEGVKSLSTFRSRALSSNGGQFSSTDAAINNAGLDFVSDIVVIDQKVKEPIPSGAKITLYPLSVISAEDLADAGLYEFTGSKWEFVPAVRNAEGSFTFEFKKIGIYALIRSFADDSDFLGQGYANMKPGETQTVVSDVVRNGDGSVAKNQVFNVSVVNQAVIDVESGEANYGEPPISFPATVMTDEDGKFSLDLAAGSLEGEVYIAIKSITGYAEQTERVIVSSGEGFDGEFQLGMEVLGYETAMPQVGQDIELKATTSYESSFIEWSVVDIFGNKKSYMGQDVTFQIDEGGIYGIYCFSRDKNGFIHMIYGELPITDLAQDADSDGISDSVERYYGSDSEMADSEQFYDALKEGQNESPSAEAGGNYAGVEGAAISFDAGQSSDPDGDKLTYRWDFDGDGNWDTEWSENPVATYIYSDDFTGNLRLQVSDGKLQTEDVASVEIDNVAAVIDNIEDKTVDVSDSVSLETSFVDAGAADTHTASIDWGDGMVEAIALTGENQRDIRISHVYDIAGDYNPRLSVTDDDGAVATKTFMVVVVKRTTNMVYNGDTEGRYGDTVKLSISLTDKLGGVAGKNVIFYLGDKTVSAITDGEGKAVTEISIDWISDDYMVRVVFQEEEKYLASEIQAELSIKSIRQVKQDAMIRLKTLAALLGQKEIEQAAANAEDSLAAGLWSDDFHLSVTQGHKVFDNEKQVIMSILKITEGAVFPMDVEIKAELQSIIDDIMFSDEALVDAALVQAKNMTALTPEFSAKQNEEIKISESELIYALQVASEGDESRAIDEFKKAWGSVQLAIEFALRQVI